MGLQLAYMSVVGECQKSHKWGFSYKLTLASVAALALASELPCSLSTSGWPDFRCEQENAAITIFISFALPALVFRLSSFGY